MKKSLAFTLAEVLITLAIIGVVAAMTIPSVIVNTNQSEFKTGLRKAVSVLNSSLTMNMALEGETPYDNGNLFGYLQQHMSVMKSTTKLDFNHDGNLAFYTTDGMRFEIPTTSKTFIMHESTGSDNNNTLTFNDKVNNGGTSGDSVSYIGACGSSGLAINTNNTANHPCMIMVDVNGDRKPNPNANSNTNGYLFPQPNDKLLRDVFTIMITDEKAIPYGVIAQKAMYQAQK